MSINQYQLHNDGYEIDAVVIPILDNGELLYVQETPDSQIGAYEVEPIMTPGPSTVDLEGNVYTSASWTAQTMTINGIIYNNLGYNDILIQKLSPTGVVLWTLSMGSNYYDDLIGLQWVASIDSLIVYGDFGDTFYANTSNLNSLSSGSDGQSLFVAFLDRDDGSTTQLNTYSGSNNVWASALGFSDFDGSVLLAGYSDGFTSVTANSLTLSCLGTEYNCIFWFKINTVTTTTTGQIETNIFPSTSFLFIGVDPQVPTTVIAGGACQGGDCGGTISGITVSHTSFIVHYDTTNNNAATVWDFGQQNSPMISMAVSCNHTFVSGSFTSTASGVQFLNPDDFLSANGNEETPGNYIFKLQTSTNLPSWYYRIDTEASNYNVQCYIASDYSGADYSVGCAASTSSSFSFNFDGFQYQLPNNNGGVFVWNGTDSDPNNCPLPLTLGCPCNFSPLFDQLRSALPGDILMLDPFNV